MIHKYFVSKISICFLLILATSFEIQAQNNTWQIELETDAKYYGYKSLRILNDSLIMEKQDTSTAVAINSISTIRFYRCSFMYDRMVRGAEIGGGIMGLGTLLYGLLNNKDSTPKDIRVQQDNPSGNYFLMGLVVVMTSAAIGGIIGGIIGMIVDIHKSQDDVYEMANHPM